MNKFFQYFFRRIVAFFPERFGAGETGIVALLCHKHVHMFVYCLQSLFYQLDKSLPVHVINDGSLTTEDIELLKSKFSILVEDKKSATRKVLKIVESFPFFSQYLSDPVTHIKKLKFLAVLLSPFKTTICIEPDIFFFNFPSEIHERILGKNRKNLYLVYDDRTVDSFKKACNPEMQFRKLIYKTVKIKRNEKFNAGLMIFSKLQKKQLAKIDDCLKIIYEVDYQGIEICDELLFSTLFDPIHSSAFSAKRYPSIIDPEEYNQINKENIVILHYAHLSKDLFIKDTFIFSLKKLMFRSV